MQSINKKKKKDTKEVKIENDSCCKGRKEFRSLFPGNFQDQQKKQVRRKKNVYTFEFVLIYTRKTFSLLDFYSKEEEEEKRRGK